MSINPYAENEPVEFDACAIIAKVKKDGKATHGNVNRTLNALDRMGHRTGEVEQEGDGAGIQTDIPRLLWENWLGQAELNPAVASNPYFTIGHFMIAPEAQEQRSQIVHRLQEIIHQHHYEIVHIRDGEVRSHTLGPRAKAAEPLFLQFACAPSAYSTTQDKRSFQIALAIERELPDVHIVSFSKKFGNL